MSLYLTLRRTVYNLLEAEHERKSLGRLLDLFLMGLILANVVAVILSSDNPTYYEYRAFFDDFEYFSLYVFGIEYLLRLWVSPEGLGASSKADGIEGDNHDSLSLGFLARQRARFNWMRSPMAIIDLLAILPSLLQGILGLDLRMLRLLRLLRILKLSRYSAALRILLKVLARESGSLQAMLFILIILIILAASGIHFVEHKVQPDAFGSIPKAMWWAVVSLTTVGYGDVTPVTNLGKLFGAFVTVLGIGIAALPAGILASGFATELGERRKRLEQKFRAQLLSGEIDLNHRRKIDLIRKELGLNKEQAHEIVLDLLREAALDEREKSKKKAKMLNQPHMASCPHCGEVFEVGEPDRQ